METRAPLASHSTWCSPRHLPSVMLPETQGQEGRHDRLCRCLFKAEETEVQKIGDLSPTGGKTMALGLESRTVG